MTRVWYVFFLIIMAFLVLMLMFIMFGYHSEQTMQVDTLQTAVNDSLQTSRDDSTRMYRGIYSINPYIFRNVLSKYKVNDLGGFGITENNKDKKKPGFVAIRYIPDNNYTDRSNGTINNSNDKYQSNANNINGNNDFNGKYSSGSRSFTNFYEQNTHSENTFTGLFSNNNSSDNHPILIRGVQVIMLPYNVIQKINKRHPNLRIFTNTSDNNSSTDNTEFYRVNVQHVAEAISKKYITPANRFVSTIIIQNDDGDPYGGNNNNQDKEKASIYNSFTDGMYSNRGHPSSIKTDRNQIPQNDNNSNVADLTDENNN